MISDVLYLLCLYFVMKILLVIFFIFSYLWSLIHLILYHFLFVLFIMCLFSICRVRFLHHRRKPSHRYNIMSTDIILFLYHRYVQDLLVDKLAIIDHLWLLFFYLYHRSRKYDHLRFYPPLCWEYNRILVSICYSHLISLEGYQHLDSIIPF